MKTNLYGMQTITDIKNFVDYLGETLDLNKLNENEDLREFLIERGSVEDFENIVAFVSNASIKNSELIANLDTEEIIETETMTVGEFSDIFVRYFSNEVTNKDMMKLHRFMVAFNNMIDDAVEVDRMNILFNMNKNDSAKYSGFIKYASEFFRSNLLDGLKQITELYTLVDEDSYGAPIWGPTTSETFPIKEIDLSLDEEQITPREYYERFILQTNTIESLVVLQIVNLFTTGKTYRTELDISPVLDSSNNITRNKQGYDRISKYYKIVNDMDSEPENFKIEYYNQPETSDIYYNIKYINTLSNEEILLVSIPHKVEDVKINDIELNNGETIPTFNNIYKFFHNRLNKFLELVNNNNDGKISNIVSSRSRIYGGAAADLVFYTFPNSIGKYVQDREFMYKLTNKIYYKTTIEEDLKEDDLKKTASSQESIMLNQNNAQTYMNTVIKLSQSDLQEYTRLEKAIGSPKSNIVSYTILYKEFNPILEGELLLGLNQYYMSRLMATRVSDFKPIDTIIDEFIFAGSGWNRMNPSIAIDIKNYVETEPIFNLGVSPHKYFYGNPIQARLSKESDIIGYFISANEISGYLGTIYGQEQYQKNEINNFLDIYSETRDFFYKVLLNKAFLGETYYKLYERMFIAVLSIERFLSSKIENLKNPDMFNPTDTFNFLESYGMGVLNNMKKFSDESIYKVNIIKRYNNLARSKGSRAAIKTLTDAFDVPDSEADIRRYVMSAKTSLTGSSENSDYIGELDETFDFIEINYESPNPTKEILDNMQTSTAYEAFVADDHLWSKDIDTDYLKTLDVNNISSKYLSLTLSENIFMNYIKTSYLFSIIDSIIDLPEDNKMSIFENIKFEISTDGLKEDLNIYQIIQIIKYVYSLIYNNVEFTTPDQNPTDRKFFGIKEIVEDDIITFNAKLREALGFKDDVKSIVSEFDESFKLEVNEYGNSNADIKYAYIYTELSKIGSDNRFDLHTIYEAGTPKSLSINDLSSDPNEMVNIMKNGPLSHAKYVPNRRNYRQDSYSSTMEYLKYLNYTTSIGLQDINRLKTMVLLDNMSISENGLINDKSSVNILSLITDNKLTYNNIYENIIYNVMKTPMDYYKGLLYKTYQPDIIITKEYRDIIQLIMDSFYVTDKDPFEYVDNISDIVPEKMMIYIDNHKPQSYDGPEELEENRTKLTELIIEMMIQLRNYYQSNEFMSFKLNLAEEQNNKMEFLMTTIELFISYTSQLYKSSYINRIDSVSITFPYAEVVKTNMTQHKEDFMFLDEELEFEKVE